VRARVKRRRVDQSFISDDAWVGLFGGLLDWMVDGRFRELSNAPGNAFLEMAESWLFI
jgi:hypothetical protein